MLHSIFSQCGAVGYLFIWIICFLQEIAPPLTQCCSLKEELVSSSSLRDKKNTDSNINKVERGATHEPIYPSEKVVPCLCALVEIYEPCPSMQPRCVWNARLLFSHFLFVDIKRGTQSEYCC